MAKASLTITGQDLLLLVGDPIPDLNYTISGWKHNDSNLSIGANPASFSALKLWLDASDSSTITHSSNAVSQWNDKSGNNNHATQATSSNKPSTNTSSQNGLNVLDFSDDFMVSAVNIDRSTLPYLSIFAVFASKSASGDGCLFGADNGGWDRTALLNFDSSASHKWGISNAGGTTAFSSSRTPDLNYHILSIGLDTGVSNGSFVSLDGETPTSFTESAGSAGFNTTAIGALRPDNGSYPMQGYLAEMIFIGSVVSDSERRELEGYLAHKWGLMSNLPSNHSHRSVSLYRAPVLSTNAPNTSSANSFYVRPDNAASNKYAITYVDGDLIVSNKTVQNISWGQDFSGLSVGQTVDLNASASSNLSVIYSLSNTSVA